MEQFAYTVSHDLKSPLVTISGFLGLLEQDVTAGDATLIRSDIQRIASAANALLARLPNARPLPIPATPFFPPSV